MLPIDRTVLPAEPGLLSRRSLLSLGALLALPSACAVRLLRIGQIDLDAIGPSQVLLLGRIRVMALDIDRSGDAFIRTNVAEDDALLPPDGQVAWVVQRLPGTDIRLHQLSSSAGLLVTPAGTVLTPDAVRAPIAYFGTINITMTGGENNRSNGRVGKLEQQIVDEHDAAMRSFVDQNPKLAKRPYYNVLRGAMFDAPPARGARAPS